MRMTLEIEMIVEMCILTVTQRPPAGKVSMLEVIVPAAHQLVGKLTLVGAI